jgi:secondary thiamine-phosphate synthase enzyme
MQTIVIQTTGHTEMIEITKEIAETILKSNVKSGVCTIFVPHTTAGITINENADPAVREDILNILEKLIPRSERYSHAEGNAPAHIKSSIFGHSLSIIIENNKPVLGAWQGIFFCELDGPRSRTIYLQITPA